MRPRSRRRPLGRSDLAYAALSTVIDALARNQPITLDDLREVVIVRAGRGRHAESEIEARLDAFVERRRPQVSWKGVS